MSCLWMRRALLALVSASTLLLAACGSGTIESQLHPTRIVVFGDAFSDLGQNGSRYTVNDGSVNVWTQQVAANFGLTLATVANGGTSYATGSARVTGTPDAAGNSATPTITQQIATFLSKDTIQPNDLYIVSGGTADIITQDALVRNNAETGAQMVANAKQAGTDLAEQVRRLVNAGAAHIVVVGPYDLSKSLWAINTSQTDLLFQASAAFNNQVLVSLVDLGQNVLYIDAPLFFNVATATPTVYGMSNSIAAVCTSADPGPGIGIGPGQINSALCTTSTLLPGVDYNQYLFADWIYPTAAAHRQFGTYAYSRITQRW
jgi:outer membrane lipase/esterase